MSNRSRWTPPHKDPTKVSVAPTPVSQRRQDRPLAALKCNWTGCPKVAVLPIGICLAHAQIAHRAYEWHTMSDQQRNDARLAELEAERARTAELVEKGLKPPRADLVAGWVYYIKVDDTIKIGFTKDVTQRMRAYPPTAHLLAVEPGTKATEAERHSRFHAHLEHGREWFRDNEELRTWIGKVVTVHGDPEPWAYTYTTPHPAPVVGGKRANRRW